MDVNADGSPDLELVSCDRTRLTPTAPSPPDALIGRFMLTLTVGAECAAIPDAAKTRRYLASIDVIGDGQNVVTLSDATFLTGPICTAGSTRFISVGCHQFCTSTSRETTSFSSTSPTTTMRRMEDTSWSSCRSAHGSRSSATPGAATRVNDGNGNGQPVVLPLRPVLSVSVFRLCELPFQRPAADIHAAVSRKRHLLGLHTTWITRSALSALECARRQPTDIAR
jgi:hypothetical protein